MHQTALKGCVGSLVTNKNLLAKVYFPRELFPFSKIGAAVVDFGVGLIVLFGLMLYFGVPFHPGIALLPLVLLLHMVLLAGFGLLLSAANLFYRDVQYVFDVVVLLWMFASPVFIDPARPTTTGVLLKTLNPMHPVLTSYRSVLLDGDLGNPAELLHGAAWALLALVLGVFVFARREPEFAERV
jgi:ABC-type polysaccharide/polyol phosphate export permease